MTVRNPKYITILVLMGNSGLIILTSSKDYQRHVVRGRGFTKEVMDVRQQIIKETLRGESNARLRAHPGLDAFQDALLAVIVAGWVLRLGDAIGINHQHVPGIEMDVGVLPACIFKDTQGDAGAHKRTGRDFFL